MDNNSSLSLTGEVEAAKAALKDVLYHISLVLRFRRDVRDLGVERYIAGNRVPNSIMDPLKNSIQAYTVHCDNIERRLCEARSVVVNGLLTADTSLAPVCGISADMLKEWHLDVVRLRANPAASSAAAGVTLDADDKARVMDVDGANNDWSAKNATDDFDNLFGSLTGVTSSIHSAVNASGTLDNDPKIPNKQESTFSTTPLGFMSTESTDFDALLAGLGSGPFSH